jgi:hypothetical protein
MNSALAAETYGPRLYALVNGLDGEKVLSEGLPVEDRSSGAAYCRRQKQAATAVVPKATRSTTRPGGIAAVYR